MKPTSDPKYGIDNGKIVNVATGKPIPDDEPIFILRAQDFLAEQTIAYYLTLVANPNHKASVRERVRDFQEFRNENAGRMKMPDTVIKAIPAAKPAPAKKAPKAAAPKKAAPKAAPAKKAPKKAPAKKARK